MPSSPESCDFVMSMFSQMSMVAYECPLYPYIVDLRCNNLQIKVTEGTVSIVEVIRRRGTQRGFRVQGVGEADLLLSRAPFRINCVSVGPSEIDSSSITTTTPLPLSAG